MEYYGIIMNSRIVLDVVCIVLHSYVPCAAWCIIAAFWQRWMAVVLRYDNNQQLMAQENAPIIPYNPHASQ